MLQNFYIGAAGRIAERRGNVSTFRELYTVESDALEGTLKDESKRKAEAKPSESTPAGQAELTACGGGGEPYVRFAEADRVGLALSGGGIRSATFNLGLLQGMNDLGLLGLFDYLSTVSGGGYIGGWWTAFRNRKPAPVKGGPPTPSVPLFPETKSGVEPPEVRHLREFSNFLAPRIGIFESETWALVVTAVGTIIPTLAAALSVLVLTLGAWIGLTAALWVFNCTTAVWTLVGLQLVVIVGAECYWLRGKKALPDEQGKMAHALASLLGLSAVGVVAYFLWSGFGAEGHTAWEKLMRMSDDLRCVKWNGQILFPSLAWSLGAALILFVRWLGSRSTWLSKTQWRALGRAASRFLALAFFWALISLAWWAGQWLRLSEWGQAASGTGIFGGGGLFAYLQKRLAEGPKASALKVKKSGAMADIVGPIIPSLLAYAVVLLMLALLASLAWPLFVGDPQKIYILFFSAAAVILLVLFFFDPARMGMHEYYRARLCRAYLGASRDSLANTQSGHPSKPTAPASKVNIETDECEGDDLRLSAIPADPKAPASRPIHLICCTANDLAGDRLATLSRGAKSGVFSPQGLFVGGKSIPSEQLATLTLSSALTASAAAFNSNMGSRSVGLGLPVHFLMSALNLRLGLWVGGASKVLQWLPGRRFFLEMFGRTHADLPGAVHLSDGGQFENTALYELVRRHCRYIIVSDCGADPDVVFADMGIAQRRVREDFGAEIEIDLNPLRPGPDGLVRQHMVVGTIHYNGLKGFDKGSLLCFKPGLTGDEPADILNYKSGHGDFPHQTTGDQFYDEAQWESYRRLGEHAARSALRFAENMDAGKKKAQTVFSIARNAWYPSPPRFDERQERARERLAEFQDECEQRMPSDLFSEFFAELGQKPPTPENTPENRVAPEKNLQWMLRLIGLMEDIYLECDLAALWNHPHNRSWMNWMFRWSASKTFRAWWPLLRALCEPSFQGFVTRQLEFGPTAEPQGELRWSDNPSQSNALALPRGKPEYPPRKRLFFWYDVDLKDAKVASPLTILGLSVDISTPTIARWKSCDYQALPGLWGSGYGSDFMKRVHQHLSSGPYTCNTFEVTITPRDGVPLTDHGTRREIVDQLEFYRSQGYLLRDGQAQEKNPVLVRTL